MQSASSGYEHNGHCVTRCCASRIYASETAAQPNRYTRRPTQHTGERRDVNNPAEKAATHPSALLQEIAHCPVIAEQLANPTREHDCAAIIQVQPNSGLETRQLPEPWSGNLGEARLLFLSSNASINLEEDYPNASWPEPQVADFFQHRFGDGQTEWTRDGLKPRRADGSFSSGTWVHFWAAVRARATELLNLPVVPGKDYVLSEVVHCKSEGESGVWRAADFCSARYLERVVSASAARVIVSLGKVASYEVRRVFGLDPTATLSTHAPFTSVRGRDPSGGTSRRYRLTALGLKLGVLLVKLRIRLLGPLATLVSNRTAHRPAHPNAVDAAFREVDTALDHLSAALGLKPAA